MFDFFLKKKNSRKFSPATAKPFCGAGFTLIELLVVIAIVGLLAVIVVVNLGDSKNRGRDAVIKSSLLETAKTAEDFAGNTGSYEGVCDPTDTTLSSSGSFGVLKTAIEKQGGTISCKDSADGFAVISTMNYVDCWCVDYEAISREVILTESDTCADVLTIILCP